jgi:hypothetical protein
MSPHARETRPFASEVKFLVDAAVGARIRDWARLHMQADPHGTGVFGDEYHTTSLYFDTDARDVFHQRGSFGRSKYRVRRYGDAPSVFLERKLRKPGILVKRRTIVGLNTIGRLGAPEPDAAWPGEWFHRRLLLRRIKPVCLVSYSRMARTAATADGPARLTLDDDVRVFGTVGLQPEPWKSGATPHAHDAPVTLDGAVATVAAPASAAGPAAGLPVLERQVIVELKYRHQLPALFKRLVEEFGLAPQRASKYRLGITALEALDAAALTAPATRGDASHA